MRVVAVADTDSYVKWAAALVSDERISGELLVLDTELVVSDAQLARALIGARLGGDRVRRVAFDALPAALAGADVVVAAARGPVARVVARTAGRLTPRPVIATGLPGISIPPTRLALHFRRECDVFVLHSHREVREFARLAAERGIDQRFALATLPFAHRSRSPGVSSGAAGSASRGTDLVFAAQAIVPREEDRRMALARVLVEAARADPSRRVVVKLRGTAGEAQTHRELLGYPEMLARLGEAPENLVVSYAPMSEALASAEGLVTVSSTAAIEAAAAGVPVIAFDGFGVSDELINTVFLGSGLLAGAGDVVARRLRRPDEGWLADNYFHDPSEDTWVSMLRDLVARRAQGRLPAREAPVGFGGRAREAWDRRQALGDRDRTAAGTAAAAVGPPIRFALRAARRTAALVGLAGRALA